MTEIAETLYPRQKNGYMKNTGYDKFFTLLKISHHAQQIQIVPAFPGTATARLGILSSRPDRPVAVYMKVSITY